MPFGEPRTLPDGREWNGLAYVHNAPVDGCHCGSCDGWFNKMQEYRVNVLHVPPVFMVELGLDSLRQETITIKGFSLEDAKRRAGIE